MKRTQHPEELRSVITMDPPMHDRVRALASKAFSPRAVAALEPMVTEVISGFLDQHRGRREFDLVEEFSSLFPVEVISRMLGIPEGERQEVRHRLDRALSRVEGQTGLSEENEAAFGESFMYFLELTQERRKRLGDDMISALIQAEVEREDGSVTKLEDQEIAGFAGLVGAAGAETVIKLIGNAGVLFGRHQDSWHRVVANRDLVPGALEEVLRYYPPSQIQGRFAAQDVTFSGTTIPAGNPVLLLTGAATRDDREFPNPDEFDIDRPPTVGLFFGHGVHFCLGAALARLEGKVTLNLLADRYPSFSVDEFDRRRPRAPERPDQETGEFLRRRHVDRGLIAQQRRVVVCGSHREDEVGAFVGVPRRKPAGVDRGVDAFLEELDVGLERLVEAACVARLELGRVAKKSGAVGRQRDAHRAEYVAGQPLDRVVDAGEKTPDLLHGGEQRFLEDGAEQIRLAVEVLIEEPHREPGTITDVLDGE